MLRTLFHQFKLFSDKMKDDAVSAFSAQAAFFIILSFIPFLMLILTMIQYLPITEDTLILMVAEVLPPTVNNYVVSLINEIYSRSSVTTISITAITALWSASKGFLAVINGFNFIYGIPETRNYIRIRFIAVFYTLLFAVTIVVSLTFLVFGNRLFIGIISYFPILKELAILVLNLRSFIGIGFLFLLFAAMYMWIPNRKSRLLFVLPGAVLASVSWFGFSFLYSIYIDNFANFNTYGSLTVLIFCMLWLYFCMYILFIGCEVNAVSYKLIESFRHGRSKKGTHA